MLVFESAFDKAEEYAAFADVWVGVGVLESPIMMNLKSIS
jgi:hypothetical protein